MRLSPKGSTRFSTAAVLLRHNDLPINTRLQGDYSTINTQIDTGQVSPVATTRWERIGAELGYFLTAGQINFHESDGFAGRGEENIQKIRCIGELGAISKQMHTDQVIIAAKALVLYIYSSISSCQNVFWHCKKEGEKKKE